MSGLDDRPIELVFSEANLKPRAHFATRGGAEVYATTRLSHAARASLLVSALFVVVVDDLASPMAKRTRTSGGGPLSPGVAFTSTDLWYVNSRAAAPPAAPSPSPSSSSGSATPTAVAFVGDSTFDFQEDAWEEELARRTPRVLIKWRVNGETTEAFARRVRRAKTTTTLARCDHVIVCTGKNDFAFGVAELIRQNTMAAVLVLRAACGPETHIHVLPPTCILKPGYRATAAEVVRLLRSELQQHGDPRISLLTPRTAGGRALLRAAFLSSGGRRALRQGLKLPRPWRWRPWRWLRRAA